MSRKQRIIVILGIAISAIFLYFAFRELNPEAVWGHIQSANLPLLIFSAAWWFVSLVIIALRWQFLLRGLKYVPLMALTRLTAIGYMGNNVYPLRTGEILRLVLLQRNHGVPFSRAAVVVIAERVFDGLVMLTFVILGLGSLNLENETLQNLVYWTAPLFAVGLITFFVLAARPNLLRRLVGVVTRILPGKLREIALRLTEDVLAGLESFRSPRDLFGTILCSYGTWGTQAIVYWAVAFAFGLEISFLTALLVMGVVNLVGLIPASPGQVGVFEFFAILVMTSAGVPDAPATAYALVVHVIIWLPVTLWGFSLLARQGLSWSAIRRARELEQEVVTP
jgi:uncharacterized protein (TIRG00374 family)